MYRLVIKGLLSPAAFVATTLFLVTPLTYAAEPQQILYKWTDASGQIQYTQTPPEEADIPFEEVNDQQMGQHSEYTSTSTTAAAENIPVITQDSAPVRQDNDRFSPVPQNARIIPNSYGYKSTEYNISPSKAALDKSRGD